MPRSAVKDYFKVKNTDIERRWNAFVPTGFIFFLFFKTFGRCCEDIFCANMWDFLKTLTFWVRNLNWRHQHQSYSIEIGVCGSVVGIATLYGLDSLGIESLWSQIFRVVHTGSEADAPSYTMGTGSFPWVRPPKRGADHPRPFSIGLRMGRSCNFTSHLCLRRHVVMWRLP